MCAWNIRDTREGKGGERHHTHTHRAHRNIKTQTQKRDTHTNPTHSQKAFLDLKYVSEKHQ